MEMKKIYDVWSEHQKDHKSIRDKWCEIDRHLYEQDSNLTDSIEMKLDEADRIAASSEERLSHDTLFKNVKIITDGNDKRLFCEIENCIIKLTEDVIIDEEGE